MRKLTVFCPDVLFCRMLCLEARQFFETYYLCDEKNKQQTKEYLKNSDVVVCDADSEFYKSVGEKKNEKTVFVFFSKNGSDPRCVLRRPFDIGEYIKLISLYAENGKKEPDAKLTFDKSGKSVNFKGKTVFLTKKESELFGYLFTRKPETVSRNEIRKNVFGIADESSDVDRVYINYIRKKFKQNFGTDPIETVRNKGYKFKNTEL